MHQYLKILDEIIDEGDWKPNRTGIKAKSIPSAVFKHDMQNGFPLLTTKKMPFKLIASELEFFIKGLSDKAWLQERGNHIWDNWCNPAIIAYGHTEDIKNDMKKETDLGRIYGVQWRNWKSYDYMSTEPIIVDQLKNIIETIKTNPSDRRMICTAWNPGELDQMALPPCHLVWQVVMSGENFDILNLNWYQRSCDAVLGLPFDIASYGLLMTLLCLETGKKMGRLTGFMGDTHIYENQMQRLQEQRKREPKPLPKMTIPNFNSIFNWIYEDRKLLNYSYWPAIKYPIAV